MPPPKLTPYPTGGPGRRGAGCGCNFLLTLPRRASKFLEDVKARAGEKSLLGKMAAEFLAM